VVALSNHISRKNAIIAVTKSAYATFHAPPWWPRSTTSFLLMTIVLFSRFLPLIT